VWLGGRCAVVWGVRRERSVVGGIQEYKWLSAKLVRAEFV